LISVRSSALRHHMWRESCLNHLLQSRFPRVQVERQARVVKAGRIITSAGIAAGMDMALTLVADLHGETIARQTARHMEYPFPERESQSRRGDF